jgi:3-isopropylmalate/(R)-2-methylmalate dehydratase small subunit
MAQVISKLGDDVSTDVIYPGRYMATVLPTETPQYAFADDAELNGRLKSKQVPPGSIIVAGTNFGCGSSREQACSCLKGYELTIVARGFARIFLQNSINLGLNLVTAPEVEASPGDELAVAADRLLNRTTGRSFAVVPLPRARQAIVDAGGLIAYTRKRVLEAAGAADAGAPGSTARTQR